MKDKTAAIFLASLLLLSLISSVSCSWERKFDSRKWKQVSDIGTHPQREAMLNDLLDKTKLCGFSKTETLRFLGKPDFHDTIKNTIGYDVITEFASIDPVYSKTLILDLDKADYVIDVRVVEFEHE